MRKVRSLIWIFYSSNSTLPKQSKRTSIINCLCSSHHFWMRCWGQRARKRAVWSMRRQRALKCWSLLKTKMRKDIKACKRQSTDSKKYLICIQHYKESWKRKVRPLIKAAKQPKFYNKMIENWSRCSSSTMRRPSISSTISNWKWRTWSKTKSRTH